MGFLEQYELAVEKDFIFRVEICLLKVAGLIQGEDPSTPEHALRSFYASAVANAPLSYRENVAKVIASRDDGPKSGADDGTLEAAVTASWDLLAGVQTK
jgi:hypothetical protein